MKRERECVKRFFSVRYKLLEVLIVITLGSVTMEDYKEANIKRWLGIRLGST